VTGLETSLRPNGAVASILEHFPEKNGRRENSWGLLRLLDRRQQAQDIDTTQEAALETRPQKTYRVET
jgi:hypothetical protein